MLPLSAGHGRVGSQKGGGGGFRKCSRSRDCAICEREVQHRLSSWYGDRAFHFETRTGSLPIHPFHGDNSAYTSGNLRNVVLKIVRNLVKSDINIWLFHSEGETGLFEITAEPLPLLKAADTLIFSQVVIKSISANHGYNATMFPKPFEKPSSAGSHIHISISRLDVEESFLAGILDRWAALAALYAEL
jgi:glutamine synthetase